MIAQQSHCYLIARERISPQELPGRAYALAMGWRSLISIPGWEGLIVSDCWRDPLFRLLTFRYGNVSVLSRVWAGSWSQILRLRSVPDVVNERTIDLSGIGITDVGAVKRWRSGRSYRLSPEKLLLLCLLLPNYGWAKVGIGKNLLYFTPYQSLNEEIVYEEGVFGWVFLTDRERRLPDVVVDRTYSFLVHLLGVAKAWNLERLSKDNWDEWILSWSMRDDAVTGNFSLSADAFSWEEAERPTGVQKMKFSDFGVQCTTPDEIWAALLAMRDGEISRMYWAETEFPMRLYYFPEVGLAY